MNSDVTFILVLLSAALVLFVLEWLPIEVTALAVLSVLVVTGKLTPAEAVEGFSNKAVIAIAGLLVLSQALTKTGIIAVLAERLENWAQKKRWLGVAGLLAGVAVLSGFLNNTAIVAMFIPLVIDLCRRLQMSPSRVLLPLSYASIFGGTLTLIGTSTNLLVSSIAQSRGIEPIGMFELSPLGIVFLILGLTYVLVAAPRLLPERVPPGDLADSYGLGGYLTEVSIDDESELIGKTCRSVEVGSRYGINVLAILRDGARIEENPGMLVLRARDVLIVQGQFDGVVKMRKELGVSLLSDVKLSDKELTTGAMITAEVLVAPNSSLAGRTLAESDFRRRFGGFVMALRRHADTIREKVAHTVLHTWDALLTYIPRDRLEELRRSNDVIVLSELPLRLYRQRGWWLVLFVLPTVIALSAFGVLDITGGALVGVTLLLAARAITPREAYGAVNWSVVVLIAAFVPVGKAVIDSGAADLLASGLLDLAAVLPLTPAVAALALLYLTTSLLTQMVSNAAAAIIVAPIAIRIGESLGADPRPFLVAVCFAASAEFMTPMGYQTNLMVYAPGRYRFVDYVRFGAPLNLLFWLTASALIWRIWPF